MKNILFIGIFFIAYGAFAQTNTFPTSGNVGLGTTSPSFLLHVTESPSMSTSQTFARFGRLTGAYNGVGDYIGIGPNSVNGIGAVYRTAGSWGLEFLTSNNVPRMRIDEIGNVGIGTASPTQLLSLDGFRGQPATSGTTQNGIFRINAGDQGVGWGETLDIGMHVGVSGPASFAWLQPTNKGNLAINYNLSLNPNGGNVGIGTTAPSEKLSVNGNIRAKKLYITQSGWSDYVFYKNYKLRPLQEVERYIQQHQHLPEVPSAKEVATKGISVGDTQALLLKKIEELTLYLIEVKKEVHAVKEENKTMKAKIEGFENKLK